MTSITFFIIFVPILTILLLGINILLAPHNPYQEKGSVFECGFHSFLGQNRTQFSVSFFVFGLLFLLFDLEILLVYPYSVSNYNNDIYGLIIMMLFFILLTLGFIFELGKNALTIESKQTNPKINYYILQAFNFLRGLTSNNLPLYSNPISQSGTLYLIENTYNYFYEDKYLAIGPRVTINALKYIIGNLWVKNGISITFYKQLFKFR